MKLEEILKSEDDRFRVSEDYYSALKAEALEKAKQLGWKVVVVDFAKKDNLYTRHREKEKFDEKHKGQNVLFFHENVNNTANVNTLSVATGVIEMDRFENRNYKFITTFDLRLMKVGQSADTESPYHTKFNPNFPISDFEKTLEQNLRKIIDIIKEMFEYETEKTKVLNIIGKSGSGKTKLLRLVEGSFNSNIRLSRMFQKSGYDNAQIYQGREINEIYNKITQNNKWPILLLDEAGLVTPELHELLVGRYKVIVYASHKKLPFQTTMQYDLNKPV